MAAFKGLGSNALPLCASFPPASDIYSVSFWDHQPKRLSLQIVWKRSHKFTFRALRLIRSKRHEDGGETFGMCLEILLLNVFFLYYYYSSSEKWAIVLSARFLLIPCHLMGERKKIHVEKKKYKRDLDASSGKKKKLQTSECFFFHTAFRSCHRGRINALRRHQIWNTDAT